MKKKGFTLVEMLAIIAVLGVMIVLVFPQFGGNTSDKKEKEYEKIKNIIESAAKSYHSFNQDEYKIPLSTLISEKFVTPNMKNPVTGEILNGCVRVTKNQDDIYVYTYASCDTIEVPLTVELNGGETTQIFSSSYNDSTKIELIEPTNDTGKFIGWEVVEGNSIIKKNTLIIGTTETIIKAVWENENAVAYITNLFESEATASGLNQITITNNGIAYDAGIRYVGSSPNNNVYFNCESSDGIYDYGHEDYDYENNCETWKIVGIFDVEDGDGKKNKRIKIVNTESTFAASWDSSTAGNNDTIAAVNNGWGINQWGESTYSDGSKYEGSDIFQLLNGYYIGKLGSECKYNNNSGQSGFQHTCTSDTLTSAKMKPLTLSAKKLVDNAIWYTYATDTNVASTAYLQENGITTKYTGKSKCPSSTDAHCNDTVNRTTTWEGLVGLLYVSDVMYSGGWLYNGSWLITPSYSVRASYVRTSSSTGVGVNIAYRSGLITASLYLKHDIKIIGGNGVDKPYIFFITQDN